MTWKILIIFFFTINLFWFVPKHTMSTKIILLALHEYKQMKFNLKSCADVTTPLQIDLLLRLNVSKQIHFQLFCSTKKCDIQWLISSLSTRAIINFHLRTKKKRKTMRKNEF